jgi:hypothetical protein
MARVAGQHPLADGLRQPVRALDLRNHQAIVQPRLYDSSCLMVMQITLPWGPFRLKNDLPVRSHCAIVQPRLDDSAVATRLYDSACNSLDVVRPRTQLWTKSWHSKPFQRCNVKTLGPLNILGRQILMLEHRHQSTRQHQPNEMQVE